LSPDDGSVFSSGSSLSSRSCATMPLGSRLGRSYRDRRQRRSNRRGWGQGQEKGQERFPIITEDMLLTSQEIKFAVTELGGLRQPAGDTVSVNSNGAASSAGNGTAHSNANNGSVLNPKQWMDCLNLNPVKWGDDNNNEETEESLDEEEDEYAHINDLSTTDLCAVGDDSVLCSIQLKQNSNMTPPLPTMATKKILM
jgi:hypothetical protein